MLVTSLRFLFFFTVGSFNIFSVSHPAAAAASQAFPSLKVGGEERRVRAGANKLTWRFSVRYWFGTGVTDIQDRKKIRLENKIKKKLLQPHNQSTSCGGIFFFSYPLPSVSPRAASCRITRLFLPQSLSLSWRVIGEAKPQLFVVALVRVGRSCFVPTGIKTTQRVRSFVHWIYRVAESTYFDR